MGFMDLIKGQLLDNIEFSTDDKSLLSHRYDRKGKQIMMNASLTVRPGQIAIFVNEGQIADVFEEGRYTLSTQNLPVMTMLNSWKYGFDSPFIADVYFLMVDAKINQKWGTANKVGIKHEELGKIYIGANGQYSYRISDPEVFMRKIVASANEIYIDECKSYLNTEINAMFKDTLSESKFNFDDAFGNLEEFGQTIKEHGEDTFKELGLQMLSFTVSDLVMPDSLYKVMEERSTIMAYNGLNMGNYSEKKKVDSASEAIVKMAEREGGGNGITEMGMEMSAGVMMGQMMGQMMSNNVNSPNQQQSNQTQQDSKQSEFIECTSCHKNVIKGAKFCSFCGNNMESKIEMAQCIECHGDIPVGSKFCPICGSSQEKNRCIKCNAELTEGAKFCMQCGAKQVSEPKNIYCPNCGEIVNESSKFCSKCGYKRD